VNQTFKNTLGLLPNGVLILDLETEKITFANKELTINILSDCPEVTESASDEYDRMRESLCGYKLKGKICNAGGKE